MPCYNPLLKIKNIALTCCRVGQASTKRQLLQLGTVKTHIGAQLSLFRGATELHPYYGELPMSAQLYLRVFPTAMLP